MLGAKGSIRSKDPNCLKALEVKYAFGLKDDECARENIETEDTADRAEEASDYSDESKFEAYIK